MAIEVVVFSLAHHNKANGSWGVFFVYGSVLGASVIFGIAMGRRFWWQAGLGAAMAAYIWLTVNVQILTTLFLGLLRNFLYFVNGYEFYMYLLILGSFLLAVISALISPVRGARG
ncbi:MAG TPA: hypothetical protein VG735_16260 [Caulobacterales bacterium]|nr:hypothetical protein [Caulobacterales bacterium]